MLVAEATPERAAGTAPTTASVAGAITQDMARVSRKNQAAIQPQPVVRDHSSTAASSRPSPASPADTTGAVPTRWATLFDEPAPTISPSVIGLMIAPAWMALKPCANCRYWVRANAPPSSAKNATPMAAVPTLKRALRKNPRSSIGSAMRDSHTRNPASSATLAASTPRKEPESQPSSGASMIA